MTAFQRTTLQAVLVLALAGCGDSAEMKTAELQADPCALLSDVLLKKHLDIGPDAAITRRPSQYSPHPLCTATAPKPNSAELEQQQQAAMQDYLQRKLRGEDVKIPSLRTDYEVSLTLLAPAESSEQAAAQFDSAMKMLQEGVTGGTKDVELTFQADIVPVDGVGDKSMWADKLHQLSILDGRHILHVGVNTGEGLASDRSKAIAIASEIIAAI